MAEEITITMEDFKEAAKGIGLSSEQITKAYENIKTKSKETFQEVQNNTKILASVADGLTSAFKSMSQIITSSEDELVGFGDEMNKVIPAMNFFVASNLGFSSSMLDFKTNTDIASQSLASFDNAIIRHNTIVGKLETKIPALGALKIDGQLKNALELVSKTNAQQESLIGAIGSSGGFSSFNKGVSGFEGMSDLDQRLGSVNRASELTDRVNAKILTVSNSLNIQKDVVAGFAQGVLKIPTAFNAMGDSVSGSGAQVRVFEQALLIARGTTGNTEDALKALTYEYDTFGKVTEKANQYQAQFYEVSKLTGMQAGTVSQRIMAMGKEFALLGDNTKGIAVTFGALTNAFKDVGVGPEKAAALSEKVVNGFKDLSMEQIMVMDQGAGGSGSMQRAMQIKQGIAEGKVDEVAELWIKSIEKRLRGVGSGEIVTMEESASGKGRVETTVTQLELLKSGSIGGGIKLSEAEAANLLKVLDSGKKIDFEQFRTALENAPADAATVGQVQKDKFYDASVPMINDLARSEQLTASTGALAAQSTIRDVFPEDIRKQLSEEYRAFNEEQIQSGEAFAQTIKDTTDHVKVYGQALGDALKRLVEDLSNKPAAEEGVLDAEKRMVVQAQGKQIAREGYTPPSMQEVQKQQSEPQEVNFIFNFKNPDGTSETVRATTGMTVETTVRQ